MDVKAFLKKNESKWAESAERAKKGGSADYPDGVYLAQVTNAEITESSGGRPQTHVTWTFQGGEFDGLQKHAYDGLDGEDSLYYLAIWLARFGYDPSEVKLSKLEETLDDLVDRAPFARIKLLTKKGSDFQNVRVMKVYPANWDPANDDDDEDAPAPRRETKKEEDEAPTRRTRTGSSAGSGRTATRKPDPEEETPAPSTRKGRTTPAPAPEPEPEGDTKGGGESEEDVDLEVGMTVTFEKDGRELVGKVLEIDEDGGVATVKAGVKKYKVPFDDLSVPEVDE